MAFTRTICLCFLDNSREGPSRASLTYFQTPELITEDIIITAFEALA
jgi:hypothetical protein